MNIQSDPFVLFVQTLNLEARLFISLCKNKLYREISSWQIHVEEKYWKYYCSAVNVLLLLIYWSICIGALKWKRGFGRPGLTGTTSSFLIPAFPERLDGSAPVIDGAILITVTCYVKRSQTLKIRAGFSGHSLFALVQEQESGSTPPSVTSLLWLNRHNPVDVERRVGGVCSTVCVKCMNMGQK